MCGGLTTLSACCFYFFVMYIPLSSFFLFVSIFVCISLSYSPPTICPVLSCPVLSRVVLEEKLSKLGIPFTVEEQLRLSGFVLYSAFFLTVHCCVALHHHVYRNAGVLHDITSVPSSCSPFLFPHPTSFSPFSPPLTHLTLCLPGLPRPLMCYCWCRSISMECR